MVCCISENPEVFATVCFLRFTPTADEEEDYVLRRQRSLSGPRQTSNLPPFSLEVRVPGSYWPGELSWLGARDPDWQASDPSTHAIVNTGLQVRILRNAVFKYLHHPADVELNDHGRIQTECLAYLDAELSADSLFK